MFSVVKAEIKILKSDIESIPDLWIRGSKEKYFLCPPDYTERIFINAARNRFTPLAHWKKIKCQILESKFSTYQLSKAAEDSIVRNMELKKRSAMKHVQHVNNDDLDVAIHSETKDLDKVISKKVEGALSEIWRSEDSNFQKELEKIISGVVDGTIAKHLEGVKKLKLIGGTRAEIPCSKSVNQLCTTFDLCAVDDCVNVEYGEISVVASADEDLVVGPVGNDGAFDDTCGACSTADICALGSNVETLITLPIRERFQTELVNEQIPENYNYFLQQVATGGGKKIANTMRIVSNSVIADSVLKAYSFNGQRKKDKFNIYPNIIAIIVKCTMEAHNKANALRKQFVPVTEKEVKDYFKIFIRYADQRDA